MIRNINNLGKQQLKLEPSHPQKNLQWRKVWETWSYEYSWKGEWERTTQFLHRHIHAADQTASRRLRWVFSMSQLSSVI